MWRGTGGREPGSNGGGKCTGGERREDGRRDTQGSGSRSGEIGNEFRNIAQCFAGTSKQGGGNGEYKVCQ